MMRVKTKFWWCKNCGIMFLHYGGRKYALFCSNSCRSIYNYKTWYYEQKRHSKTYHRDWMRHKRHPDKYPSPGTRTMIFTLDIPKEIQIDNSLQLPMGEFGFSQGQEELGLVSRNGDRENNSGS